MRFILLSKCITLLVIISTWLLLQPFSLKAATYYSASPISTGCTFTFSIWVSGVPYAATAIVQYPANEQYYQASHDNPGYDPTISTYFWTRYPAPPCIPTQGKALTTSKVIAGYWTNWSASTIRIREINLHYNVVYLFSARPVGGSLGTTGAVYWSPPGNERGAATYFASDIQYARTVQKRKIILSVGGAGYGMSFPSRAKSQVFLDSITTLYKKFGGFDGLDWNTFEGDQAPDTNEMIWISLQLKHLYPGFIITAPPAPWNPRDLAFCDAMVKAGALDYAAPQYYDGKGINVPSFIMMNIERWVSRLGQEHVALGLGVWNQQNYMTIEDARNVWNQVNAKYPNIRGVFNWQISTDEEAEWIFANQFGAIIQ